MNNKPKYTNCEFKESLNSYVFFHWRNEKFCLHHSIQIYSELVQDIHILHLVEDPLQYSSFDGWIKVSWTKNNNKICSGMQFTCFTNLMFISKKELECYITLHVLRHLELWHWSNLLHHVKSCVLHQTKKEVTIEIIHSNQRFTR